MKQNATGKLFDINIPRHELAEGEILVAEPFLREGYFNHAVITLVDYSRETGALGLVMNNRLESRLLGKMIDGITREDDIPVFCGGPVSSDRLFYLHTLGELFGDSTQVSPGLYVGGDFSAVLDYVNSGYALEGRIRFFVGYSGWEPGQLEGECMEHVWAVHPSVLTPEEALSGAEDAYWHKVVRGMGSPYRHWLIHPKNPSLN